MASPSTQLEAALAQFSGQQGVTPDQVAQLRAALTADARLLRQFDQAAQAEHLKGFALQAANSNIHNLVGAYDIQSGVVMLPRASFQTTGPAPSTDLKATLKVQQMSVEFGNSTYQDAASNSHSVTQDMVDNLQSTINNSPVLADEIKRAVTTLDPTDRNRRAQLEHFGFVGPGVAAGGTYDGINKVMHLPPLGLQTNSASNPQGRFSDIDMTFVLGHEIQHGFNHTAKVQATNTFLRNVGAQARAIEPVHDYTDELRTYIQAGREDEARAEIAGWNAVMSRERQGNPSADLDHMLKISNVRLRDFVQQDPSTTMPKASALSGLTFDQNGSLPQTSANIAAMGQHYFDRPSPDYAQSGQRPVGLGEHKNLAGNLQPTADYPNYYGTWAVEQILVAEDQANVVHRGIRPRLTIDMASIGLKEDLIEKEGLDLGRNKAPRPYYDSSHTPASLHHFDHTQDGSVSPQQDHQYVPISPSSPLQQQPEITRRQSVEEVQRRGHALTPPSMEIAMDAPVVKNSAPSHQQSNTPAEITPMQAGHPEHALYQQVRAGVAALDASHGRSYDQTSERLTGSLLVLAKSNGLDRVDHVVLSSPTAGQAGGHNVFVVQGEINDPGHLRAGMSTQQAVTAPFEQSMAKFDAVVQEQAQAQAQQLNNQRETADHQQETHRSAMRMG
ncbi:MAG: XVIPCD domain-containing protein [Pseudomonas sp.]|uniref:XVIPCD domain-containing protein n=1 Tax=Pseudomonas sp. TaxID=306 RepID=UPI003D6EEE3B